jgi:hypothetical protein
MRNVAMKYAVAYWMRKWVGFLAAALLAALAVTEWLHSSRFPRQAIATDGVIATGTMPHGGQLEKPAIW